jgi:hypothetical protein
LDLQWASIDAQATDEVVYRVLEEEREKCAAIHGANVAAGLYIDWPSGRKPAKS